MNVSRTGKIARIPLQIREELNRRILDGEPGKESVAWLNTLPEVLAVVAGMFGGRPIREQNLSEWKQGGYRDWLANQEARGTLCFLAEESEAWRATGLPPLSDSLSHWLAARYAVEARGLDDLEGDERWERLRELGGDVAKLRRGDHSARRLAMEDSRLELEEERVALARRYGFQTWKSKLARSFEAFMKVVEGNPEARAALDEVIRLTQSPLDAMVDEPPEASGVT